MIFIYLQSLVIKIVGRHKIYTKKKFFFVAKYHSRCDNSNIKKLIQSYTPSRYCTEVPVSQIVYCIVESSFRHVTERVIKGNQSLESSCALGNKELLKTKKNRSLTFDFVYHPQKSLWPSDGTYFYTNVSAVTGYMLWRFMNILNMFGC